MGKLLRSATISAACLLSACAYKQLDDNGIPVAYSQHPGLLANYELNECLSPELFRELGKLKVPAPTVKAIGHTYISNCEELPTALSGLLEDFSPEEIQEVVTTRTRQGQNLFWGFDLLEEYLQEGGSASHLKELLSLEQRTAFVNPMLAIAALDHTFPILEAPLFADFRDAEGEKVYYNLLRTKNAHSITEVLNKRIPFSYAQTLMTDFEMKPKQVATAHKNDFTIDEIRAIAQKEPNLTALNWYLKLGVRADEIGTLSNTEKPNAVIQLPFSDYNGVFYSPRSAEFYRELRSHYDVHLEVAKGQTEVCDMLKKVPEISFVVLAGHGDGLSARIRRGKADEAKLNVGDDFAGCFANLVPEARMFLFSCLGGQNRDNQMNLANYLQTYFGDRRIIASELSFSMSDVEVTSHYPFSATIVADPSYYPEENSRDITYSPARE